MRIKNYAVYTLLMTFWLFSCPIISYCHVHTHIVIGPLIHRRLISSQASVKIVSERICHYAYEKCIIFIVLDQILHFGHSFIFRKMMFTKLSCGQSFAQNREFCGKYEMSLLRRRTPHTHNKHTQQSLLRV